MFSTYRDDSEISRLRRGELRLADASEDVRTVLDLCADVQLSTGGAFSAMHAGQVDPTGLVKGWAIGRAGELLRAYGSENHAVNGGGDVLVAGHAAPGRPWGVGIVDPHDRAGVVQTIACTDLAVATSSTSERGQHNVDPFTARPAAALASATVVGPDMALADAYATAAFVLGTAALSWLAGLDGYEGLLVTPDGECRHSDGWPGTAPLVTVGGSPVLGM
jgi:thiamine biosynthesis lipoprotein